MTDKPEKKPEAPFRGFDGYRWDEVPMLAYKEEGAAPFKAITRQVLFANPALACEMRYFEVAPGGYSTLERHEHTHGVMILRGAADVLVGDEIRPVKTFDLVHIPPMTWHQFRTTGSEPMGFLCMVNAARDKPQLPNADEMEKLKQDPAIKAFLG